MRGFKSLVLAATIASVGLAGCSSTNTQQENTGIGAVTGAVAGGLAGSLIGGGTGKAVAVVGGAIAGALIGGYIGHSMDSTDNNQMLAAMNNPKGQSSTWVNQKTGTTYTVTPTSNMITVNGNPNCRRFYTTAIINGKKQSSSGVACQSNGTWVSVR